VPFDIEIRDAPGPARRTQQYRIGEAIVHSNEKRFLIGNHGILIFGHQNSYSATAYLKPPSDSRGIVTKRNAINKRCFLGEPRAAMVIQFLESIYLLNTFCGILGNFSLTIASYWM